MKNEGQKAFEMIKNRYFQLDKDFDTLLNKCENDLQKQELRENYQQARNNYKKIMNKAFNDNSEEIKNLTKKLEDAEKKIDKALEVKENMDNVIKAVSISVGIANKIVGMVL